MSVVEYIVVVVAVSRSRVYSSSSGGIAERARVARDTPSTLYYPTMLYNYTLQGARPSRAQPTMLQDRVVHWAGAPLRLRAAARDAHDVAQRGVPCAGGEVGAVAA